MSERVSSVTRSDNLSVPFLPHRGVRPSLSAGYAVLIASSATCLTAAPAHDGEAVPVGEKAAERQTLHDLGHAREREGKYDEALKVWEQWLKLAQDAGDKRDAATALYDIGDVSTKQGNYASALACYQKSLALGEESGDRSGTGKALYGLGEVHRWRGSYPQALEFFQKALVQFEASGNKDWTAGALYGIGVVHYYEGNLSQGLEFCQKSLTLAEEVGYKPRLPVILTTLGNIHGALGNDAEALALYDRSLSLAEALKNKPMVVDILYNLAGHYRRQGNYARALEFYQKGLAQFEASGDQLGVAQTLCNIGAIHEFQGNYAVALELHQRALTQFEALGVKPWVRLTLTRIGQVYAAQCRYAEALGTYQRVLTQCEESGDRVGIAGALGNIGEVHRMQRNHTQALEFLEKSLRLRETLEGKGGAILPILVRIAAVHLDQGNPSKAADLAKRASTVATQLGDRREWQAPFIAGLAHRALNRPLQAREDLEEALLAIETLRSQLAGGAQEQQSFFEVGDKIDVYHAMVDLLVERKNPAEALTYAERAKARVLLDVLRNGKASIVKAMTPYERDLERKLNNELVSLNTMITREAQRPQPDQALLTDLSGRLQKARLDYEASRLTLYAAHPELKVQRGEARPLSPEETGLLLPNSQAALLEFVLTKEKTFLFVLTKGMGEKGRPPTRTSRRTSAPLTVYVLNLKREDLANRVTICRERAAHRDPRFRLSARELYDLLLRPARRELRGKTRWVLVPDGVLWEVPFQALQPREDRYLIEDCAISYAPSLAVLREMMRLRSSPSSPTLLAMGNPTVGKEMADRAGLALRGAALSPLPQAEREVKTLGALYGAGRSRIYLGAEAEEGRVKSEAGEYGILHFATHGILDNVSPMYSQVVLAPSEQSNGEDGFLEAREIMDLNLQARQVVLSACETARGRVREGEGVIGLTWAFFVAGCPATVVSQWKVADESTTALMAAYYRQLKSGKPKDEALRLAQLSLRHPNRRSQIADQKSFCHPFYWAPFVLVGDWR